MSNSLSNSDVSRLLSDPSANVRAATAVKVAAEFDQGDLSANERRIAEDIFRIMVRDAEVRVRQALSQQLKESHALPHDVALTLARDVDHVARPILEYSEVLTDADLVEIVHTQSSAKQLAVARRQKVSAEVADALVETNNEEVVVTLVGNNGADLTERSLQKVIDNFGDHDAVHQPLVHRASLPVTVAERLVTLVSASLRDHLVSHHELSPAVASDLVLQSRERATVSLLTPGSEIADVERLVEHLHCNGRLTPSLILRALCMGDLSFFEAAIARLAGIPIVNARILIHDRGDLGLKSVYAKAGLPQTMFRAVRVAVDVARETDYDGNENDRERYSRRMIERILTQYADVGADNLEYLLAKLSQFQEAAATAVAPAPVA